MISLSGLPAAQDIQKSEDEELIKHVRNNSIGLMSPPPDISNIGLRHTHRGIESYDIRKEDAIGVFDSAMYGLHANSGYAARNIETQYSKIRKSASIGNGNLDGTDYIDLERLW